MNIVCYSAELETLQFMRQYVEYYFHNDASNHHALHHDEDINNLIHYDLCIVSISTPTEQAYIKEIILKHPQIYFIIFVTHDLAKHIGFTSNYHHIFYIFQHLNVLELYKILDVITGHHVTIKSPEGTRTVNAAQVLYVDMVGRQLHYVLENKEFLGLSARKSFGAEVKDLLNYYGLELVSQTLLINISRIEIIGKDKITFDTGQELYVSPKVIKIINKMFEERRFK